MTRDEKTVALASAGLLLATIGAFLPWARIGGRSRSGFSTADTFLALGDTALPDVIAWVGRWWYLPALLALLAWASVLAHGHVIVRAGGVAAVVLALTMWWVFIWGGRHWDVLNTQLLGPTVATVGLVLVAAACARTRASVLRHQEATDGDPLE